MREVSREDELEVEEDEKGSYIFNSKDLNMLPYLKELQEAGVDSIKIEGRMKSSYYVATVVNAYRMALDNLPKPPSKELCDELLKASHRRYTTGFYFNETNRQFQEDSMPVQDSTFIALVTEDADGKKVQVEMRNKFSVGDEVEILSPDKNIFNKKIKISKITTLDGEEIESARKVQEKVYIPCELPLKKGDILRK